jgi:hypothetical protein
MGIAALYLKAYNFLSFAMWAALLVQVLMTMTPFAYQNPLIALQLKTVQLVQYLDLVHAIIGIARTSPVASFV